MVFFIIGKFESINIFISFVLKTNKIKKTEKTKDSSKVSKALYLGNGYGLNKPGLKTGMEI